MDNRRVKFCLKILSRFKKIIRKPQGSKIFWRTLYIVTYNMHKAQVDSKRVICTKNRVAGPGSKIYYPVPNPGNWYPFFLHRLLVKLIRIRYLQPL